MTVDELRCLVCREMRRSSGRRLSTSAGLVSALSAVARDGLPGSERPAPVSCPRSRQATPEPLHCPQARSVENVQRQAGHNRAAVTNLPRRRADPLAPCAGPGGRPGAGSSSIPKHASGPLPMHPGHLTDCEIWVGDANRISSAARRTTRHATQGIDRATK